MEGIRPLFARVVLGIVLSATPGCMMSACVIAEKPAVARVAGSTELASSAAQSSSASAAGQVPTESSAEERYIGNLRVLLERQVVPHLRQGIMRVATSRPPSLTVTVIADPSPYNIGAKVSPDGSLAVHLTTGYATLHDAALDAVAVSAVLRRPRDLRRYLIYQLQLAHRNEPRRASGSTPQRGMTFADFIGLERSDALAIFAQPKWRTLRDGIEAESLGWTLAQLLVRADPGLSGISAADGANPGAAGAHLAAASGWFPVPPFATALGFAEIDRSVARPFDGRALLCRAACFMEAGLLSIRVDTPARAGDSQNRIAEIQSQILSMRRDGRCAATATVAQL